MVDLYCSQVRWWRNEAAPLFGLLKFGHRVYIVISVCLTQTLLKSLLLLRRTGCIFNSIMIGQVTKTDIYLGE